MSPLSVTLKGPDKTTTDQTYKYSRDWHPSASWDPIDGLLKLLGHHGTIWDVGGPWHGPPLCRNTPVSRTVDVNFWHQVKALFHVAGNWRTTCWRRLVPERSVCRAAKFWRQNVVGFISCFMRYFLLFYSYVRCFFKILQLFMGYFLRFYSFL